MSDVWGIVLAGGGGTRFGGEKQFVELDSRTLLEHALAGARTACAAVVVVVPEHACERAHKLLEQNGPEPGEVRVVAGGDQRADSVRAGLAALPEAARIVLIADAAHPLATPQLYAAVVGAVRAGADGAVPGVPITEAIAPVQAGRRGPGGVPREGHVLVQMPHAFSVTALRAVHAGGAAGVEDSAMVAAWTRPDGRPAEVAVVAGEPGNLHITTPAELELARRIFSQP